MPPEPSPLSPTPLPSPTPAPALPPSVDTVELQKALADVALKLSDPMTKSLTNHLASVLVEAIDPSTSNVKRAHLLERIEQLTDALRQNLDKEKDAQVREHLIKLVGDPATGARGLLQEFITEVKLIILRDGRPQPGPVRPLELDEPQRQSNPFNAPTSGPNYSYDPKTQEIKIIDLSKKIVEDALLLGATQLAEKKREQEEWARRAAADEEARHKELIHKIIHHVIAIAPKNGGDGGDIAAIINAVSAPFGGISEGAAVARAEQVFARVAREAEERSLAKFPGGQKAAEALHSQAA